MNPTRCDCQLHVCKRGEFRNYGRCGARATNNNKTKKESHLKIKSHENCSKRFYWSINLCEMCFFSYHRLYNMFMSFDACLAPSFIWLWTFKRLKLRVATCQTMYAKICLRQKLAKEMAITFWRWMEQIHVMEHDHIDHKSAPREVKFATKLFLFKE